MKYAQVFLMILASSVVIPHKHCHKVSPVGIGGESFFVHIRHHWIENQPRCFIMLQIRKDMIRCIEGLIKYYYFKA
jgi:hypothetical protein